MSALALWPERRRNAPFLSDRTQMRDAGKLVNL
jgi:hypothetical protein